MHWSQKSPAPQPPPATAGSAGVAALASGAFAVSVQRVLRAPAAAAALAEEAIAVVVDRESVGRIATGRGKRGDREIGVVELLDEREHGGRRSADAVGAVGVAVDVFVAGR